MAIIDREFESFEGEHFEWTVRVGKAGVFKINLPPKVAQSLGHEHVEAPSKDEALAAYNADIRKYRLQEVTTRKVIRYAIQAKGRIEGKRLSKGNGIELSLWADVCEEMRTKWNDGTSTYTYKSVENSFPVGLNGLEYQSSTRMNWRRAQPDPNTMLWTEEREAFFVQFYNRFEDMVCRLLDATGTPKSMESLVNAGVANLLGPARRVK